MRRRWDRLRHTAVSILTVFISVACSFFVFPFSFHSHKGRHYTHLMRSDYCVNGIMLKFFPIVGVCVKKERKDFTFLHFLSSHHPRSIHTDNQFFGSWLEKSENLTSEKFSIHVLLCILFIVHHLVLW